MLSWKQPENCAIGILETGFFFTGLYMSVRFAATTAISAIIEAPIRFYITENPDGTATLRYRKPTDIFAPFDGGEKLKKMAQELDVIFAKIAKDAVGN